VPGFRKKDEVDQQEDQREEDYEKLFAKIGRDFITREDLADILLKIINAVPGLSIEIGNAHAMSLATEYKENISASKKKKKKYKDLVELEDNKDKE
jgi:hypothetical protein